MYQAALSLPPYFWIVVIGAEVALATLVVWSIGKGASTLPPREREVVLLKFHGQLSNSELAKALDVSESNAGTRLHRARARLQELLEPHSPTSAAIAVQPPNAATKGAI